MTEEEQEHLDRFPPAEPGRRNRHGHQGRHYTNGSADRFPFSQTQDEEAGLAL